VRRPFQQSIKRDTGLRVEFSYGDQMNDTKRVARGR
jgi:hypothetical protein